MTLDIGTPSDVLRGERIGILRHNRSLREIVLYPSDDVSPEGNWHAYIWEIDSLTMRLSVRGFLATYRWELWLILGIPVVAGMSHPITGLLWAYLIPDVYAFSHFAFAVEGAATLLLLAISYPRVRDLGRDFLTILWGYLIASSAILTTAQGVLFTFSVVSPTEDNWIVFGRTFTTLGLALIPEICVLIWFARRASRLSLTHAVFLLAYSSHNLLGSVTGHSTSTSSEFLLLAHVFAGGAIGLIVALAKVWLLGNFERRGPTFRRDAVIGLFAMLILSGYIKIAIADLLGSSEGPYLLILPFLGAVYGSFAFFASAAVELAFLGVFLGLVYLVRVRPAAVETEPEPETVTEAPGEER